MKKEKFLAGGLWVALVAALFMAVVLVAGCATESTDSSTTDSTDSTESSDNGAASIAINVISREDGSGTRSAFVELFEVQEDGPDGKLVDATTLDAVITNSTSVMLTTISGDPAAIGYISLGSLNDTVKALDIDGVPATTDNVTSGAYPIQRPFNIAVNGELSDAAQDFIDFIMSSDGQKVIEENHYVAVVQNAPAFVSNNASGKVVVAGSSSVSPVMEKLKEAYMAVNPNVTIEIQTSDSSTGMSATAQGICDIGMASRALKDSEKEQGLESMEIALDGIAVIVNNANENSGLTKEQVRGIYLGEITNWKDIT